MSRYVAKTLTASTLCGFERASISGPLPVLREWCADQWELNGDDCFIFDDEGKVIATFGDIEISEGDCIDVDGWLDWRGL